MTFSDIFKKKFLEGFTDISVELILVSFGIATLLGIFIFFIYKLTFGGVMYSCSFNISLFGLTILTTFVILAVTSNAVLSLGMVGALSIVRFRTAIKDPMDLVFLFWAIGAGIVTGAQFYPLALIGSLIIGAVLLISSKRISFDSPYLVVVNCDNNTGESECLSLIQNNAKRAKLKSKVVSAGKGTELIYEIRSKGDNTGFIDGLLKINGVHNASLVSYNGEYLD